MILFNICSSNQSVELCILGITILILFSLIVVDYSKYSKIVNVFLLKLSLLKYEGHPIKNETFSIAQ